MARWSAAYWRTVGPWLPRLPVLLLLSACAGAAAGQDAHDVQVPASEPRETLEIQVDLAGSSDCDERFDLALYADRGVDLVTWEPPGDRCAGRRAKVRFFPRRISREALIARIRRLSTRLEVKSP